MSTNSYTKQTWEDAPSTNSPVSAERLNHMETGIKNNNTGVRALETAVGNVQNLNTSSKEAVGAINEIKSDLTDKVSITADGVKTRVQILNSLYALIDKNKITNRACVKITNSERTEYWKVAEVFSDLIRCSKTKTYSDELDCYTLAIKASNSEYNQAIIKTGSIVINGSPASTVEANGVIYDFYY